ncbi:hypothetical protein HPB48_015250 [Haemaphysalis longicornis]|uniref:Uncharacterized protein n=1 Tax=Haemaphysalis longicornis TaxID=44386 RepID=A0A9J6FIL9_HAELO|nr:hypothetical protein HPB48_015250 [Haemaphysalis longicornis]
MLCNVASACRAVPIPRAVAADDTTRHAVRADWKELEGAEEAATAGKKEQQSEERRLAPGCPTHHVWGLGSIGPTPSRSRHSSLLQLVSTRRGDLKTPSPEPPAPTGAAQGFALVACYWPGGRDPASSSGLFCRRPALRATTQPLRSTSSANRRTQYQQRRRTPWLIPSVPPGSACPAHHARDCKGDVGGNVQRLRDIGARDRA